SNNTLSPSSKMINFLPISFSYKPGRYTTMAAATKAKNGAIANSALYDIAAQTSEGAKAAANNVMEVINIYNENGVSLLNAQQSLLQSSLDIYQQYSKAYGDFIFGAYQYTLDQSLAWREQFAQVTEAYCAKAQELAHSEQKFVLESVESFQAQTKVGADRVVELFTSIK
ncbi:MAG: hypothetical protein KDJ52_16000, partial [Anaerolineae bacterium]|nr:hypothetical protein [Anaerolineae bacterium]